MGLLDRAQATWQVLADVAREAELTANVGADSEEPPSQDA
jgi:hypothetical protein